MSEPDTRGNSPRKDDLTRLGGSVSRRRFLAGAFGASLVGLVGAGRAMADPTCGPSCGPAPPAPLPNCAAANNKNCTVNACNTNSCDTNVCGTLNYCATNACTVNTCGFNQCANGNTTNCATSSNTCSINKCMSTNTCNYDVCQTADVCQTNTCENGNNCVTANYCTTSNGPKCWILDITNVCSTTDVTCSGMDMIPNFPPPVPIPTNASQLSGGIRGWRELDEAFRANSDLFC